MPNRYLSTQVRPQLITWRTWVVMGMVVVGVLLLERSQVWPRLRTWVWRMTQPTQRIQSLVWQQSHTMGTTIDIWQRGAQRLAYLENEVIRLESIVATQQIASSELSTATPGATISSGLARDDLTHAAWYGAGTTWFVNVGCEQGVRPNQAVVFQGVLVGKIARVFRGYSEVQTWYSSDWRIQVRIGSDGPTGLLTHYHGSMVVTELPVRADVQVGAPVFTVGDGLFAPRVVVGQVRSIEDQPGDGGKLLQIEPFLRYSNLQNVSVHTGVTTQKDICFESEYTSSVDGSSGPSQ